MREYETIRLVKSEDLNPHNTLFAARGAAWIVEAAFGAAACEAGGAGGLVCRNLHDMAFQRPVKSGALARLLSRVVYAGRTSLTVHVTLEDAIEDAVQAGPAVEAFLTFVTVEEGTGRKREHGVTLDEPADEKEREEREAALQYRL